MYCLDYRDAPSKLNNGSVKLDNGGRVVRAKSRGYIENTGRMTGNHDGFYLNGVYRQKVLDFCADEKRLGQVVSSLRPGDVVVAEMTEYATRMCMESSKLNGIPFTGYMPFSIYETAEPPTSTSVWNGVPSGEHVYPMKKDDVNALDFLAFLFSLILLPISIALFLSRGEESIHVLKVIDNTLCVFLLVHFFLRLIQSPQKILFIKQNWMEALGAIPMMEPLRFFRLLGIFRIISVIKKSTAISRDIKANKMEYHTAIAIIYFMVVMTLGASLILLFERDAASSNIKNTADAIWWVFVSISTVGYGDKYPVTVAGKILAVFVIVSGVGLFGFFISLFTQSFTRDDNGEN